MQDSILTVCFLFQLIFQNQTQINSDVKLEIQREGPDKFRDNIYNQIKIRGIKKK